MTTASPAAAAPDRADQPEQQVLRVHGPHHQAAVPQPRLGAGRRDGGAPPRLAAVLRRLGEVDRDPQQPPAARGGLLDQRRELEQHRLRGRRAVRAGTVADARRDAHAAAARRSRHLPEHALLSRRGRIPGADHAGVDEPVRSTIDPWYAITHRREKTNSFEDRYHWGDSHAYVERFNYNTSMSYVTGSHNLKIGLMSSWGPFSKT